MLNDLKLSRHTLVKSYYLKVKQYSEQLQWTPDREQTTIVNLLMENYDQCLTADCLNEIETTIHDLEANIEKQKEYFYELRSKLKLLYNSLNKSQHEYCLEFKQDKINADTVKQLEHEINSCRQQRMENAKQYCQSIRQKILNLYDQCQVGQSERQYLEKIDFEQLSPELLDRYDNELIRIEELYEIRKPILDVYNKWFSFWNDYMAFEKSSKDPGRFYVRGYNAMDEQKRRKKFQHDLPKLEQQFLHLLVEYGDEDQFLLDDIPIKKKNLILHIKMLLLELVHHRHRQLVIK